MSTPHAEALRQGKLIEVGRVKLNTAVLVIKKAHLLLAHAVLGYESPPVTSTDRRNRYKVWHSIFTGIHGQQIFTATIWRSGGQ